ncbi:WecB/TagA/CpsF family glycosyltransferase [Butyrivibrio sp. NC2002]|uniref:WecB/TagA/CpsF family glycosyltransferase n=1 Tax=Butyrivibrio sp. NC2002 TaxID=1410610 RepID=UPI000AF7FFF4|nr:WecB/TagA/CpsF family glycosyltransferase [Butyrivibrio sp. NC2002]
MSLSRSHKRRRILVIVDIAALFAAYMLMITVRFKWYFNKPWMIPLYSMVFVLELLISMLIDVYNGRRKDYKSLEKYDPLEILSSTVRQQAVLFGLVLIALMFTQNTKKMSRVAMVILVLFNISSVFIFRMIYRAVLQKKGNPDVHRRKLAVLGYSRELPAIRGHIEQNLEDEFEVSDYYAIDEAYPMDIVRTDKDNLDAIRNRLIETISHGECTDALLCISDNPQNECRDYVRDNIIRRLEKKGINTYYALALDGSWITNKLIRKVGYFQTSYFTAMVKRCTVLGVEFAVSNVDNAVIYVKKHIKDFAGKYICYCNVHTTVEASEHEDYRQIQNNSALTFPDGQPIVGRIQKAGYINAERIAGPDFMEAMFGATMDGSLSHFFYGSTEETISLLKENLEKKYPGMDIRGYYSPPFRELTAEEDEEIIRMLNASGADLIWIGLGAPKQEKWMAAHENRLSGVMLGVGAGFNFFAGNIKRAPVWVRKIGMEWLYRLFQDPKRLFKRYFESNIKFIWKAIVLRK